MPEQSVSPRILNLTNKPHTKYRKEILMKTVGMLDTHEEIIGSSGHLLAVSRKKT